MTDEAQNGAVDLPAFVLALADRIYRAHEILARRAERAEVVITETDYCPLGKPQPDELRSGGCGLSPEAIRVFLMNQAYAREQAKVPPDEPRPGTRATLTGAAAA